MRITSFALCAALLAGCNAGKTRIVKKPHNAYHQTALAMQAIIDTHGRLAEGSLDDA